MIDLDCAEAQALRKLQLLDEVHDLGEHRRLVIEAETALGEALGLECTGKESGWNEDGSVAFYSHSGGTCPIHEWLVVDDHPDRKGVAR